MRSKACSCCNDKQAAHQRTVCRSCESRKRRYGLSYLELSVIIKKTECEICECKLDWDTKGKTNSACIDHCHDTSEYRGVLCNACNVIEGLIRDDDHLRKIVGNLRKYLNKTPGQ